MSDVFEIDKSDDDHDSSYRLVLSPKANGFFRDGMKHEAEGLNFSRFDHTTARGSLALVRTASRFGSNVDVTFLVKGNNGDFVQWGERTRLAWQGDDENSKCLVLGPDLAEKRKGVFGLPFEALLQSDWVQKDAITFKVKIQERVMQETPRGLYDLGDTPAKEPERTVELPPSTLAADMLAMVTSGQYSDLAVEVIEAEGAPPLRFDAHATILCQRSEVFRAALSHQMSESQSRVISIKGVPPLAVKALLHFLYTDAFEPVEAVIAEHEAAVHEAAAAAADAGASAADASSSERVGGALKDGESTSRLTLLRALLSVAHMYQVVRLLRWCERQLCKYLRRVSVCELLEVSMLYEATELQICCLEFMQAHAADVVKAPEFARLSSEALVLYHMHCVGLKPLEATRKRKRRDED